jgi:hypothetical protein
VAQVLQSVDDWLHQFLPLQTVRLLQRWEAYFTDDDELATKMRWIRVHGQDRRYHHPVIGINGRLDTLQAAVLLAKF